MPAGHITYHTKLRRLHTICPFSPPIGMGAFWERLNGYLVRLDGLGKSETSVLSYIDAPCSLLALLNPQNHSSADILPAHSQGYFPLSRGLSAECSCALLTFFVIRRCLLVEQTQECWPSDQSVQRISCERAMWVISAFILLPIDDNILVCYNIPRTALTIQLGQPAPAHCMPLLFNRTINEL